MTIPVDTAHSITGEKMPVTMGHEFCGRVKEAAAGSKFQPGQAVVADPRIYCRHCNHCNANDTVFCNEWGFRGLSGGGGGYSQYITIHETQVYAIPENLLPYGALVEPLAVAWHAVKRAGIDDFSKFSTLIVGGGPIGIALVMCLKAFGAKQIIVSEPTEARRRQNAEFANHVLNPVDQNIGDECRKLTDGWGVDYAFDAAGVARGFHAAVDALKFRGTFINVSAWEQEV
jgi:threonine dehydrogenase-like Zn-dependent dehydrogenase